MANRHEYETTAHDVKVTIDHEHKQHYLVQDIENDDFMAKAKHSWIAHSIDIGDNNFVNENYKADYKSLFVFVFLHYVLYLYIKHLVAGVYMFSGSWDIPLQSYLNAFSNSAAKSTVF